MYKQNLAPQVRVEIVRSKMANALSSAWIKGNHSLVKSTILGAVGVDTRKQWEAQTAAALPESYRGEFLSYMKGDL